MIVAKDSEKRWIIKNSDGKVSGPFTREGVNQLITQGGLTGEELIAIHPGGEWAPLASISDFYDLILETMEGGKTLSDKPSNEKMDAQTIIKTEIKGRDKTPKDFDVTKVGDVSQISEFTTSFFSGVSKISSSIQKKLKINPSATDQDKTVTIHNSESTKTKELPPNEKLGKLSPIRHNPYVLKKQGILKAPSSPTESSHEGKVIFLSIIGVVAIIVIYLALGDESGGTGLKIRLLAPSPGHNQDRAGSPGESLLMVKQLFEKGNPSNWLEAQDRLVSLAESYPNNTEVRELLCLTHKELWPFAYQDGEDIQVLSFMAQSTRSLNPSERHGRTCEMIKSWLTGKFDEARGQLEHLLQEYPQLSFYIWLKTEMLLASNDFINGQGFASSLMTIWPEFTEGRILAAEINIKLGNYKEAREFLLQALQLNSQNKKAQLLLGDMDFRYFQKDESAFEILMNAVKSEELAQGLLIGNAFADLALISEKRGNTSAAKKFAEKGLAANPSSEVLKNLVQRLGGSLKLGDESVRIQELVALGDQYLRSGDCLAAQAQFRAAFDLNPHYPAAAVKAARCLYKMNQIFYAYGVLKKAIKYNPDYFPAYTLLADYYSQKYDFTSATAVLNQARVYSTEAYELYKGYALVELRKNNFGGAQGFIKKAIGIYGTDPESFVILARAQIGMGQAKEAFQTAQRALELDSIDVEVKVVYGEAIASIQGDNAAIEYYSKIIKENQFILEYKLALASTLVRLEQFNEVLPIYQDIVTLDPKNKKARIGMGDSLNAIGKTDEALNSYLYAATIDPSDPEPIFKAGQLYLDRGSIDPAIKQFSRVLQINPNYPLANYFIGRASFQDGNLKEALEAALAERRVNPGLIEPYLLAAEVHMVKEDYAQCTKEYQEAIKIRPLGAELYVKLARCHRKLGALDVAQSMLDIAEERESGFAEIYKEQGELSKDMGNAAAANKAFEKYLAIAPNAPDKKQIEQLMKELTSR